MHVPRRIVQAPDHFPATHHVLFHPAPRSWAVRRPSRPVRVRRPSRPVRHRRSQRPSRRPGLHIQARLAGVDRYHLGARHKRGAKPQPPARDRQIRGPHRIRGVDHRFNDADVTFGTLDLEPLAVAQPVFPVPPSSGSRSRRRRVIRGQRQQGGAGHQHQPPPPEGLGGLAKRTPGAAVCSTGSHRTAPDIVPRGTNQDKPPRTNTRRAGRAAQLPARRSLSVAAKIRSPGRRVRAQP